MRRFVVRSVAALCGGLVTLVAFVVWAVGQAQYLEDYCFTRVTLPPGEYGIRGPYLEGFTIRCVFSEHPDAVVADPLPALWLVAAVGGTALALGLIWFTARQLERDDSRQAA